MHENVLTAAEVAAGQTLHMFPNRGDAKLANEKFVANAPEEIVEEEKEKREAAVARKTKLQDALERLKKAS